MALVALVVGLVISVLAFGGVEAWAFAPAQILIVLAAVTGFWKRGLPRVGWPTLCLLGLIVAVPVVQMLVLPSALIATISPALSQLRQAFLPALGVGAIASTLSVSPYETNRALLKLVCYVLVFLLGFRTARNQRGGELLVRTLIGIGLFEAAYGQFHLGCEGPEEARDLGLHLHGHAVEITRFTQGIQENSVAF